MKYLRLKDAEFAGVSTLQLVRACVVEVPKGIKLDGMRSRLRVLDAVETAGGCLALEDADAKVLQAAVADMTWIKVDAGIVAFCDAVAEMPSTPGTP